MKTSNMKRITFFIINLTFCLLMQAQIPQAPTNLQSPNVANLGLYGEVPVSLFTGIPEISIPLYTISQKDFSVPITLSYHAGGVRPDQHPGWVGTNWTLFAGGCISRTVKGETRDELDYGNAPKAGFYWRYADIKKKNWDLVTLITDANTYTVADQMSDADKDLEADEFSFNFGDYNGKFQLNENGQWIVTCNKPVKVIFDNKFLDAPQYLFYPTPASGQMVYYPTYCKSFSGFTLVAENGVKYIFGGSTDYIEYSKSFYDDERLATNGRYWTANSWTANSWYLKEIDSPNGENVTFEYERGSFIDQMYISSNQSSFYTIADGNPLLHIVEDPLGLVDFSKTLFSDPNTLTNIPTTCGAYSGISLGGCYSAQLISPLYLKTIKTPDCTVQFMSNPSIELKYGYSLYMYQLSVLYDNLGKTGLNQPLLPLLSTGLYSCDISKTEEALKNLQWRELNAILIYKGSSPSTNQGNLINVYSLGYNNTDTERLFLTSLTSDNNTKTYSFEYDHKDLLPPYLASMTDHWGFYNGTKADIGVDYYNGKHMKEYYNQRNTNPSVMLYGSLKKITYPTGGTTEFTYEANQYSNQLKLNRWIGVDFAGGDYFTGGLRIKKMVHDANDNSAPVEKNYYYTQDYPSSKIGLSTGVLGGLVQYNMLIKLPTSDPKETYAESAFSSQSVLPACTNSMGSHIGYSRVAEENSDGSYTIYKYTNFDNGYLDEKFDTTAQVTLTPYQPYNSKEQDRGLLYQKETYDNLGKLKILEKRQYVKSTNKTPDYLENMDGNVKHLCQNFALAYLTGTVYKKYTYSNLLSDITTNFYEDQSQPLVQNQHFTYNNYNQIISETNQTSNGKTITKNTYFPLEISKNILPTVQVKDFSTLAGTMLNNNYLNPLIAEEDFADTKFIKGVYNDYTLTSTTNQPLLSNVFLSETDKTFRKVYDCTKFDKAGNPLSVTGKDQLNTVYLWSYNYRYPVAEIKNASYQQVQDALGETYINNLSSMLNPADADVATLNRLRTSLPNAQITTYTFNPLVGISSIIDPRGIKTSYSYIPLTDHLYLSKDNDDNILSRYSYAYRPAGLMAEMSVSSTIIKGLAETASVSVSGVSNNFSYSWYFMDANNAVLASSVNSTSPNFVFTSVEKGSYTLVCYIVDNTTNSKTTVKKTLNCIDFFLPTISCDRSSFLYHETCTPKVTVKGGSGDFTYAWHVYDDYNTPYPNTSAIKSLTSLDVVCNHPGTIYIECQVTDVATGISYTAKTQVTCILPEFKVGEISVVSTTAPLSFTATINLSGGTGVYIYNWFLSDGLKTLESGNSASFSYTYPKSGTYYLVCVVVDSQFGSSVTKSITVN